MLTGSLAIGSDIVRVAQTSAPALITLTTKSDGVYVGTVPGFTRDTGFLLPLNKPTTLVLAKNETLWALSEYNNGDVSFAVQPLSAYTLKV